MLEFVLQLCLTIDQIRNDCHVILDAIFQTLLSLFLCHICILRVIMQFNPELYESSDVKITKYLTLI